MTTDNGPRRGMYFEEIAEGFRIASQGRTITEADVVTFAGVSGDYNPLHIDAEYAAKTIFGARIAHGLLGLSVASGLAWQLGFMLGTVEAFRELTWTFRKPMLLGDTVHIVAHCASKKPVRGYAGGLVTFDVAVLNQRGETTQKGTWTLLIRAKPAA
jgi:acyl dehydratase